MSVFLWGGEACARPWKKNSTKILCEKYYKLWTFVKMYTWNVPAPFHISKYVTAYSPPPPVS